MSQLDQVNHVLGHIQALAAHLADQCDAQALNDLALSLAETFDHFVDSTQYPHELEPLETDLKFSFDSDDEENQKLTDPPQKQTQTQTQTLQQPLQTQQPQPQSTEEIELSQQLKTLKDIELYIGDKFTQYGITFERDLFTPNDPHKIGLIHIQSFLTILRKLGVYLTPSETKLIGLKFKPTIDQVDDYIYTHIVDPANLPIESNYINYPLLFSYIQALNNTMVTSRAIITANIPALMAGRSLIYKPSNPHPINQLKPNTTIKSPIFQEIDATESFAPQILITEHANKPSPHAINIATLHKLIRDFASSHPSPSRIYSQIKKSASSSTEPTKYGENTVSINALLDGLKTFGFKNSELPCTIDIFKQYIQIYSAENISALRFSEFTSFLACEEPKHGWGALYPTEHSTSTSSTTPHPPTPDNFQEIIALIMKDSSFTQAMTTISSADARKVFRTLSRGEIYVTSDHIIAYLIDARCDSKKINHQHFKSFIMLYSTTHDDKLNFNDFIQFRDCKVNYSTVTQGKQTTPTTINENPQLYASFNALNQHFMVTNPHVSFYYTTLPYLNKATATPTLTHLQFHQVLTACNIIISLQATLALYKALNAQQVTNQDGQIVFVLPVKVLNQSINAPFSHPTIATAYTSETGKELSTGNQKKAYYSSVTSIQDETDLLTQMNGLSISGDKKPKSQHRQESNLLSTMVDEYQTDSVRDEMNRGGKAHYDPALVKTRKQIRTSIGFGNRDLSDDNRGACVINHGEDMIPYGRIQAPIHSNASKLHLDFDNDHGGKTPVKSRDGVYSHAAQTYSLTRAVDEDVPMSGVAGKKERLTDSKLWTEDQPDMDFDGSQRIGTKQPERNIFHKTPMRNYVRQNLQPNQQLQVVNAPSGVIYTPQKNISDTRLRSYPNRNQQAAVTDALNVSENDGTVVHGTPAYTRRHYDPEISSGGILHLDDGFQPATTPFLIRRHPKFKNLTEIDPKLAHFLNPREINLRRVGYVAPNSITPLFDLQTIHPAVQQDAQLVNDIDAALLSGKPMAKYITDDMNRRYKAVASRQLLLLPSEQPQYQQHDNQFELPLDPSLNCELDMINADMFDNEAATAPLFGLDDISPQPEQQNDIFDSKQEEAQHENSNQLSANELQNLNNSVTRIAGRQGKTKEVFGKWAQYSATLTPDHLVNALSNLECKLTLEQATQLIDSVNKEPGQGLNLSGFTRLLGRGSIE